MTNRTSKIIYPVFLILLLSGVLLTSCGARPEGYGVLYWSPEEETEADTAGRVYPVLKSSSIDKTHTLERDGYPEGWTVDAWRLAFFEKEEEAAEEARRYEPYLHLFAISQQDRLAIREQPDLSAGRAYVLKLGQEMKVIGKLEEASTVGQYEGFWYKVLTGDGVSGYCFDHYLEIYDGREGPQQKVSPELAFLKEAFTRIYYPEYFREMIREQQVDLDRFSPRFGFYPSLAEQRIEMRLPSGTRVFEYETIEITANGSYVFAGSGLSVNFFGENSFAASFPVDGKNNSERFVFMAGEAVEAAVEAEKERRKEEVARFYAEGNGSYRSSAYGSLAFTGEGAFTWEGKQRLVPDVLPEGTPDAGTVTFDHFLGTDLAGQYDGVLNLRFGGGRGVLFLYTLDDSALRLTTVDPSGVREKIVQKAPFSPLVMVFARSPQ